MIRIDFIKKGVTLSREVKDKIIHVNSLLNLNKDIFCEKLEDIITPIKDSFDKILSNSERSIIDGVSINKLLNSTILLLLLEIEEDIENNDKKNFYLKFYDKLLHFHFLLKNNSFLIKSSYFFCLYCYFKYNFFTLKFNSKK